MKFRTFAVLILLFAVGFILFLTTRDSAEERAARHYERGMALIEDGDPDRAVIEFRNVFKLDGRHREARLELARIRRDSGQTDAAYSQYLRLVEQYPDDLEGRRALGEMAFRRSDWEEVERHGRAAQAIAPEDPMIAALNAALDYRAALRAEDGAATTAALTAARAVLATSADNPVARRVVIDHLLQTQDWTGALAELDRALEQDPDSLALHGMRLQVLTTLGDQAGVGVHLEDMTRRFPDNPELRQTLIAWYMQTGDLDGAEAYLRRLTDTGDRDAAERAQADVVRFLLEIRGPDAARAELDALIAGDGDVVLYRSLRAAINFEDDDPDGAIAELEEILAADGDGDAARRRDIRATLARMLEATGNHVGARAHVEEVLAGDPAYVLALQMRAAWLIEADKPGEAITALRTALDQNPRDAGTLTLMAEAHLRAGSRDLAGERLALAVEAAAQAPRESLRYARFLIADDRLATAETVLIDALRRSSEHPDLLALLGDLYLRQGDWPRAEGVIDRLDRLATATTTEAARQLRVALLFRQQRIDESVSLLEQFVADDPEALEAAALIVRTHLQDGRAARAANYLDTLLGDRPDDPGLRFLRAGVHASAGEAEAAETLYRALIAEAPASPAPVHALYALLSVDGRGEDAAQVLAEGLSATGRAAPLLLIEAGRLETAGDFEGAITVNEELYALDSSNAVIANNLASLITTHRRDDESLERAYTIARRLRGIKVPQFQDTYGWIEFRRGNPEEALAHLEPAAAGLPEDPLVQFHLGMAYRALERHGEAREALLRALAIPKMADLPQQTEAQAALDSLPESAPESGDTDSGSSE